MKTFIKYACNIIIICNLFTYFEIYISRPILDRVVIFNKLAYHGVILYLLFTFISIYKDIVCSRVHHLFGVMLQACYTIELYILL